MGKWNRTGSMDQAPDAPGRPATTPRWLHVALLAVALIGWMTFILACVEGPAWSPDSSKVMFGYYDSGGGRYAVGLYDLSKHKSKIIFERPTTADSDDDEFALLPVWQNDGDRALVLMTEGSSESTKHCTLLSLPINPKGVPRTYDVGDAKGCWYRSMILQQGDKLYLGGDDGLSWVNLTSGETDSSSIKGDPLFLHERNGQVGYMRAASRPLTGAKEKDAHEDGIEFGQVDLAGISMKPAFTLWESQFPDIKFGDSISAAWEPNGSRMALIGVGENSDKILMMDEKKGLMGAIDIQVGVHPARIGNLLWSRDGKMLYAAAISNGSKEKTCNFSLAEMPPSGAPGRLTTIASFSCDGVGANDARDKLDMVLPLALSPDGNWIAATPSNCDPDKFASSDRALYLIDLRRKDRRITRVPFPTAAKPAAQAATNAS